MARMKGMHGVCLHPGKAYVELKVRAYNRTPFVQTFLWWANVATRVHEAYQSFFPPDVYYVADHARRSMSEYPLAQGHLLRRELRRARAEWRSAKRDADVRFVPPHCRDSIWNRESRRPEFRTTRPTIFRSTPTFPCPLPTCAWAARRISSAVTISRRRRASSTSPITTFPPARSNGPGATTSLAMPGIATSPTPDARGEFAPYIEIMAGVYTDNQPDFSFLQPGETKTWSQYWYPIQKIGPAQHANLDAAVSLSAWHERFRTGRRGHATHSKRGRVTARTRQMVSPAAEWDADLAPGQAVRAALESAGAQALEGWLTRLCAFMDAHGSEIISYQPKPRVKGAVPPPATEPPAPRGHRQRRRTLHHRPAPRSISPCHPLSHALLARSPAARSAGCAVQQRAGPLASPTRRICRRPKRIFAAPSNASTRRNANPYDGEAYYNLGLCLRHLGRDDEAYAAFYKATWNQAWMAAGYHALAEIDCGRQDWATALDHLNRSLRFNTDNLRARNLKVLALRKLRSACRS